jgi:hypothetical protein
VVGFSALGWIWGCAPSTHLLHQGAAPQGRLDDLDGHVLPWCGGWVGVGLLVGLIRGVCGWSDGGVEEQRLSSQTAEAPSYTPFKKTSHPGSA